MIIKKEKITDIETAIQRSEELSKVYNERTRKRKRKDIKKINEGEGGKLLNSKMIDYITRRTILYHSIPSKNMNSLVMIVAQEMFCDPYLLHILSQNFIKGIIVELNKSFIIRSPLKFTDLFSEYLKCVYKTGRNFKIYVKQSDICYSEVSLWEPGIKNMRLNILSFSFVFKRCLPYLIRYGLLQRLDYDAQRHKMVYELDMNLHIWDSFYEQMKYILICFIYRALMGSIMYYEKTDKCELCLEKIRNLCPEISFLAKAEAIVKEIISAGYIENINYFYNYARICSNLHITDYKKSEFEENYFRNLVNKNT